MTNDYENELRKAFTFDNFKKLLYFVSACADEGLQIGECDAGDLLYCDVLENVLFDDKYNRAFENDAEKFVGVRNDY